MKAYRTGKNKAGKQYAVVKFSTHQSAGDRCFAVWTLCANYASHVRGGIAYTWRVVQSSMTLDDAVALFEHHLAGKRKA